MTTPGSTPNRGDHVDADTTVPPTDGHPGDDRGGQIPTPPPSGQATPATSGDPEAHPQPAGETAGGGDVLEDPLLAADSAPGDAEAVADEAPQGDSPDGAEPHEAIDPAEKLREELADRTEDLQRVTAEYANYRRRTERDRSLLIGQARSGVVAEFLPILDDLDLAKQHGDLTPGLTAVDNKLAGIFAKLGVTRFGEAGDDFDPEIHEAVQDISSGDDKTLGTVLRPGYRIGDKLVRTAMAIIADRPADTPTEADGDAEQPET